MRDILEVSEFDTITCNSEYKNEYAYLPEDAFNTLESFICEYTSSDDGAEALDFLKIGYKKNIGRTISVNNYVGLIQVNNGCQVQILPKIDLFVEDSEKVETKKIFLKMLRSMKDFPAKVFNTANLKMSKMNLYEIFINMYIQEVRELLKLGLKSSYVQQNENINFYKGKLDISNHIKTNIAHKERFYMIYDEYSMDRPENRIIKSTLQKLERITQSAENQKEIRQQLAGFENVKPSINYEKDFSKIVLDRTTENYKNLIEWSKVFLFNKSFTTFSGGTSARALLFPMEKVYESYVAKYMKKVFGAEGWDVSAQDRGYYLFDSPRKFALRPDLVIRKDDRVIVLDTKWKRLYADPSINYGISQSDMYQMYAYAKKYNTSEIILLYPQTKDFIDSNNISFISEDGVNVSLYFVDVANIEDNLSSLLIKLNELNACSV